MTGNGSIRPILKPRRKHRKEQITRCPVAVLGERCGNKVLHGPGWRRCGDHKSSLLNISLSRNQKAVLKFLGGFTSSIDVDSLSDANLRRALRGLSRKQLAAKGRFGWRLTTWGRDIAGGTR